MQAICFTFHKSVFWGHKNDREEAGLSRANGQKSKRVINGPVNQGGFQLPKRSLF